MVLVRCFYCKQLWSCSIPHYREKIGHLNKTRRVGEGYIPGGHSKCFLFWSVSSIPVFVQEGKDPIGSKGQKREKIVTFSVGCAHITRSVLCRIRLLSPLQSVCPHNGSRLGTSGTDHAAADSPEVHPAPGGEGKAISSG